MTVTKLGTYMVLSILFLMDYFLIPGSKDLHSSYEITMSGAYMYLLRADYV